VTGLFLEIGVVGKPHGLRGELKVTLHNKCGDTVGVADSLVVGAAGGGQPREVVSIRPGAKGPIIAVDGIETREDAERLRGARLLAPRAELPALANEEFYVADLAGLEAFEGERLLGSVVSSRDQGGVEVVDIAGPDEEVQIPLVDEYVVAIDWEGRRLPLRNTAGLPRNPTGRDRRSPRKD
jgi:16S rRNA processing protein RimM